MEASSKKTCEHCNAADATMFANDGSAVCERCYAYDQVVAGELRASQHDLGLLASGDATSLDTAASKAWHSEFGWAIGATLLSVALYAYGAYDWNATAYVAAAVLTLMAIVLWVQGVRTRRFAKAEVPKVMEKASHPPPAMAARATP